MTETTVKRHRGAPRKRPEDMKTASINTRVHPRTRRKLEECARLSGRSMAHEIERRLEQSFCQEEMIDFIQMHFEIK